MIEEICAQLREKRKKLDYTIEEVVNKTKLDPSVIRNIEEGKISKIDPAYLKGFIKIYASFLDIDALDALEEISLKINPIKRPLFKRLQLAIPPGINRYLAFFLRWILIILVLFTAIRFIKKKFKKADVGQSKNVTSAFVFSKEDASLIVTSIRVKRNCFFEVKVDGKLLFEGILKKGKVETWEAKREIEFKISDGSAVSLEVNGKMLPPLTPLRKPIKSLKITRTGISVEK